MEISICVWHGDEISAQKRCFQLEYRDVHESLRHFYRNVNIAYRIRVRHFRMQFDIKVI